jgi:hypothetical protein
VNELCSLSSQFTDPDDGDRGDLWNVGSQFTSDMADCLRKFFHIYLSWKPEILHREYWWFCLTCYNNSWSI